MRWIAASSSPTCVEAPEVMLRFLVALALLPALAGCAMYTAVPPSQATVRGALSVKPDETWNRLSSPSVDLGGVEVWTQSGHELNQLSFFVAIEDAKPLLERPLPGIGSFQASPSGGPPAFEPPILFRAAMTPSEIAELLQTALVKSGASAVETREIATATFAGQQGFRIQLGFVGSRQVRREALAVGAIKDKKLTMILFQAPRLHYFSSYRSQIDALIASARFL
jgi:hypothetical protein